MRYAICNETFGDWEHERICRYIAGLGYTGLEIAPFTLAGRITDVPAERRKLLREQASAHGVQILGLHWLLAKTTGLQVTSADSGTRRETATYLVELARCCAELGGNILVFGSPAQRRIPEGATLAQATDYAYDTFRQAANAIGDLGVTLALEPLSPPDANFLTTARETMALIERLNHPVFRLHLDVKAMSTDEAPAADLIRRHAADMVHFHANDPNLRGPGFGKQDFVPIFQALADVGYRGWVSVEVFDYTPDPETIATESLRYMQQCATQTR